MVESSRTSRRWVRPSSRDPTSTALRRRSPGASKVETSCGPESCPRPSRPEAVAAPRQRVRVPPSRLPAFQGVCSSSCAWIRNSSAGYGAARRTTSGMADPGSTTPCDSPAQVSASASAPGWRKTRVAPVSAFTRAEKRSPDRADPAVAPHHPAGQRKGARGEVAVQQPDQLTVDDPRRRRAPVGERRQARQPLFRRKPPIDRGFPRERCPRNSPAWSAQASTTRRTQESDRHTRGIALTQAITGSVGLKQVGRQLEQWRRD